jgi:hypothetical protein
MAHTKVYSGLLFPTDPVGKTAYATSDGDGDFNTLHCSALFDFSVARRWRFARLFARTLIQTWASIRSSMGSRGFGMHELWHSIGVESSAKICVLTQIFREFMRPIRFAV